MTDETDTGDPATANPAAEIARLQAENRRLRLLIEARRENHDLQLAEARISQRNAEQRWEIRLGRVTRRTGLPLIPLLLIGAAFVGFFTPLVVALVVAMLS